MQIFAGVNTRCIVFLNVLLDVTASKCVIGFTQRCSVLNNVVGEPRNYTALRLCALRAIRGHKAGRNLLTRNCMGKPEVRGLQSRWTGTEIIAAATVYNFSDRIRATTASRLNGSPQQHLVVELLEDHSGYATAFQRKGNARDADRRYKKPLLRGRGMKPIPLCLASINNAGQKGLHSTLLCCTMDVKAVHGFGIAQQNALAAGMKVRPSMASRGCRLVPQKKKNICQNRVMQ